VSQLDEALDALPAEGGKATLEDGSATVDVVEVDRIGVRVREVEVHRSADADVHAEAMAMPERMRTLPDRITPIEVDPQLGGAILRSRPEDMRDREFYEVEIRRRKTAIRKHRVDAQGDRAPVDWAMTRDQLRRLIDETSG
jgi:hypothetical protein